jgi:hypothetical protein
MAFVLQEFIVTGGVDSSGLGTGVKTRSFLWPVVEWNRQRLEQQVERQVKLSVELRVELRIELTVELRVGP